jgi:hypothetical protein
MGVHSTKGEDMAANNESKMTAAQAEKELARLKAERVEVDKKLATKEKEVEAILAVQRAGGLEEEMKALVTKLTSFYSVDVANDLKVGGDTTVKDVKKAVRTQLNALAKAVKGPNATIVIRAVEAKEKAEVQYGPALDAAKVHGAMVVKGITSETNQWYSQDEIAALAFGQAGLKIKQKDKPLDKVHNEYFIENGKVAGGKRWTAKV